MSAVVQGARAGRTMVAAWLCVGAAGLPAAAQTLEPELAAEPAPAAAPEAVAAPGPEPDPGADPEPGVDLPVSTQLTAIDAGGLPSPWPLLTVTVGLGSAGAGLWLVLTGDGEKSGLSFDLGLVDDDGAVVGTSFDEARARLDDAEAKVIAGGVLLGVGLAAIVGGAVWAAMGGLDVPPDDAPAAALEEVRLLVSPSSVGVSGRF